MIDYINKIIKHLVLDKFQRIQTSKSIRRMPSLNTLG